MKEVSSVLSVSGFRTVLVQGLFCLNQIITFLLLIMLCVFISEQVFFSAKIGQC